MPYASTLQEKAWFFNFAKITDRLDASKSIGLSVDVAQRTRFSRHVCSWKRGAKSRIWTSEKFVATEAWHLRYLEGLGQSLGVRPREVLWFAYITLSSILQWTKLSQISSFWPQRETSVISYHSQQADAQNIKLQSFGWKCFSVFFVREHVR